MKDETNMRPITEWLALKPKMYSSLSILMLFLASQRACTSRSFPRLHPKSLGTVPASGALTGGTLVHNGRGEKSGGWLVGWLPPVWKSRVCVICVSRLRGVRKRSQKGVCLCNTVSPSFRKKSVRVCSTVRPDAVGFEKSSEGECQCV